MFDISWGKIVIIGVVALVVIGPKELPSVLRMVGQWMGKMRRMAAEFQGQFQDAMREAEMADLKKTFDETTSGLSSVFDPIKNDMDKMVNDPMSTGSSAATPDAGIPIPDATADPSAPADPVALGTAPVAPPEVSVPMPEMPPPVETKDLATTPAVPSVPAPDLAQAAPPAEASPAGAAAASAPEAEGGKAA